jgi:hypothetical protein
MEPTLLLERLYAIGQNIAVSGHALALIGLGSVGLELQRLDAYSDLDFFVIVEPGYNHSYLDDLGWLGNISPVAFTFRNTDDGYKVLYADGVFCEFAVFELAELTNIPYAPGRVVWQSEQITQNLAFPPKSQTPSEEHDVNWLINEALTNLYIGLGRAQRGELLSATRFIQGYAVTCLLELVARDAAPSSIAVDVFVPERRWEQRFPSLKDEVARWIQGYSRNSESALAILEFLAAHYEVNTVMRDAIRERLKDSGLLRNYFDNPLDSQHETHETQ